MEFKCELSTSFTDIYRISLADSMKQKSVRKEKKWREKEIDRVKYVCNAKWIQLMDQRTHTQTIQSCDDEKQTDPIQRDYSKVPPADKHQLEIF